MALTITVGGNNITSTVQIESLTVQENAQAGRVISVASFTCVDDGANLSIDACDAVSIVDGGTTYFLGEVAGQPEAQEVAPDKLIWQVDCQDYNKLAAETVVTSYSVAAGTTSDADIVDALVSTFRDEADIDSTTHVTEVVAAGSMPAFS